jgi:hypothetical protein
MNPDELRKKLEDAGIPIGESWGSAQEGGVKSPILERQKALLTQLEGLVEQQIEVDMQKASELHVALRKLQRGGGE